MLDRSSIIRVFFGIPISEDVAQLLQKRLLKENPQFKNRVRWTRAGNHHITVRFLGNIAEQKIPKLIELIYGAIKDITTFQIRLWNIAPFPPTHRKTAAANIEFSHQLQSLYNAIELIVSADFPADSHPYLPHITLFRMRNQTVSFEKIALENERINVNSLILYQSISVENDSLYVPLHKFFL